MARWRTIPHDQDREDQRAEEKAALRKANQEDAAGLVELDDRFGDLDPEDDEYASVEAFAEFMYDDDRVEYNHYELQCVWFRTGKRLQQIQATLKEYGLTLARRPKERQIRGFNDSPNTLYRGNPMAGGGGGGSIIGMAD